MRDEADGRGQPLVGGTARVGRRFRLSEGDDFDGHAGASRLRACPPQSSIRIAVHSRRVAERAGSSHCQLPEGSATLPAKKGVGILSAALAKVPPPVACLLVALALGACGGETGTEGPPGTGDGPLLTADCSALGVDVETPAGGEACCGCLCASPRWSCTADTCTDADGQVEGLAAEAGYIEVPGGEYTTMGEVRLSPTQRVFYSFQPADESPEQRPLAVFFNGGPGASTTSGLMVLNTGPLTLDPAHTGDGEITENEHSFSRAYNLLYVDAPGTGFSYAQPLANGDTPPHLFDMDREAGVFNHVLLFFLRHHAALANNEVLLVGESYGATRAVQMARQLHNPESLLEADSPYGDAALYCALQAHFASRGLLDASEPATSELDVTDIASQFGHLVLIQHYLLGFLQPQHSVFDTSACVADPAPYQCDEPLGYSEALDAELVRRLLTPEHLELMLGTDPTTIAWLDPALRSPAYAVAGESDVYVSLRSFEDAVGYRNRHGTDTLVEFAGMLPYLKKVLLTAAKRDLVVDAHSIVRMFEDGGLATEEHDDLPEGSPRPGLVSVDLGEGRVAQLRMPQYETAGHMVTLRAPGELFDDVVEWMGP